MSLLLGACSARDDAPVHIRFEMYAGDVRPQIVQFFVHDVELLSADGTAHAFTLDSGVPWQSERVALIDFSALPHPRDSVTGSAAQREYSGIRFTVGVPFELNHANPLTAAAPLNRSDLFWSWQSGYKFLRMDLARGDQEASFHLGSIGCSSASALRPPQAPCARQNTMRVELQGFDPVRQAIRVRLDEIATALAGHPACTGEYANEPACAAAYALTGLDSETGTCAAGTIVDAGQRSHEAIRAEQTAACSGQRLFSAP